MPLGPPWCGWETFFDDYRALLSYAPSSTWAWIPIVPKIPSLFIQKDVLGAIDYSGFCQYATRIPNSILQESFHYTPLGVVVEFCINHSKELRHRGFHSKNIIEREVLCRGDEVLFNRLLEEGEIGPFIGFTNVCAETPTEIIDYVLKCELDKPLVDLLSSSLLCGNMYCVSKVFDQCKDCTTWCARTWTRLLFNAIRGQSLDCVEFIMTITIPTWEHLLCSAHGENPEIFDILLQYVDIDADRLLLLFRAFQSSDSAEMCRSFLIRFHDLPIFTTNTFSYVHSCLLLNMPRCLDVLFEYVDIPSNSWIEEHTYASTALICMEHGYKIILRCEKMSAEDIHHIFLWGCNASTEHRMSIVDCLLSFFHHAHGDDEFIRLRNYIYNQFCTNVC